MVPNRLAYLDQDHGLYLQKRWYGDADAYATTTTFSADASVVTSERAVVAGAVEQYIRFVATRTSGTCTVWCTIARDINLDA